MSSRKISVAVAVVIALVTVTTLLLCSLGAVHYLSERDRRWTKLHSALTLDADQLSAGLSLALWNFDRAQIDRVVDSMMKDATIYGVVLKFADAQRTLRVWSREDSGKIQQTEKEFPGDDLLSEERTIIGGNNEILGRIKLFATKKYVEAELQETLVSTVSSILVFDVVLTLSLYLLLWRWVLNPLKQVEAYAVVVSSGGAPARMPGRQFRGELQTLRLSIERMIGQLDSRYTELQAADKLLRRQAAFDELINRLLARFANASGAELDEHICKSLEEIARFMGMEYAVVVQLSRETNCWSCTHEWCADGVPSRRKEYQNIPLGGYFDWTEKKILAGEVVQAQKLSDFPPAAANMREHHEQMGFKSSLRVPLLGRGGLINGSLGLNSLTREVTWEQQDIRRLQTLTDAIANALERKQSDDSVLQSREQLRALTSRLQTLREEERTHIAREIHDHLGQLLTALKLDMRSIERKVASSADPEFSAALQKKTVSATKLIDETIESVQKIAAELRPGVLDRLGLAAAIEAECKTFQIRTGLICSAQTPKDSTELSQDHATAMFRIFQEILTNIARHAHARQVSVRLTRDEESLLLEVRDDGVGIQPADIESAKSLGLLGMRERAAMLGGTVLFAGKPDAGTTVTVWIPFDRKLQPA